MLYLRVLRYHQVWRTRPSILPTTVSLKNTEEWKHIVKTSRSTISGVLHPDNCQTSRDSSPEIFRCRVPTVSLRLQDRLDLHSQVF